MTHAKNTSPKPPTKLELQILSVLYSQGSSTARSVLESMPDGKKRAYTTILSAMQQMEAKGLLTHERIKSAHVFSPTQPKETTIGSSLKQWVSHVFNGRADLLMASLLDQKGLGEDELAEIERLVQQARKEKS
jgi:BlaI family penicillinase repressor